MWPEFQPWGTQPPTPFPWPVPLRPRLPEFPAISSGQGTQIVWSRSPYKQSLSFTPPAIPSKTFKRSNFCGTRVPGLVWKPGMGGNPSTGTTLCMDLDIFKYGPSDTASQDLFFDAKIASGCTHIQVSIEHAAELFWMVSDVIAYCKRWQARGGWCDIWWCGAAVWSRRDNMWADLAPKLTPWVDAMVAAGVVDECCFGWQLEGWLGGTPLVDCALGCGKYLYDLGWRGRYAYHNLWDGCANWDDQTKAKYGIEDRFSFWTYMASVPYGMDVINGQTNVNGPQVDADNLGGTQNWARDIESQLKAPNQYFVPYEYAGQDQFDNPDQRSEASGNQRGWLQMAALTKCGGFGNGAQSGDPNNGAAV